MLLLYIIAGCSIVAAIFALLSFLRGHNRTLSSNFATKDDLTQTLRGEADRIRAETADQARGVRQEVVDNIRGFQSSTLHAFGELGKQPPCRTFPLDVHCLEITDLRFSSSLTRRRVLRSR